MLNVNATVTVTESCPTCSQSSLTAAWGDMITLTCSVNYAGSAVPVLQWAGSGGVTADCSRSGTVCSELSVNVQSPMTTVESRGCELTSPPAIRDDCQSWYSAPITVSCT